MHKHLLLVLLIVCIHSNRFVGALSSCLHTPVLPFPLNRPEVRRRPLLRLPLHTTTVSAKTEMLQSQQLHRQCLSAFSHAWKKPTNAGHGQKKRLTQVLTLHYQRRQHPASQRTDNTNRVIQQPSILLDVHYTEHSGAPSGCKFTIKLQKGGVEKPQLPMKSASHEIYHPDPSIGRPSFHFKGTAGHSEGGQQTGRESQ